MNEKIMNENNRDACEASVVVKEKLGEDFKLSLIVLVVLMTIFLFKLTDKNSQQMFQQQDPIIVETVTSTTETTVTTTSTTFTTSTNTSTTTMTTTATTNTNDTEAIATATTRNSVIVISKNIITNISESEMTTTTTEEETIEEDLVIEEEELITTEMDEADVEEYEKETIEEEIITNITYVEENKNNNCYAYASLNYITEEERIMLCNIVAGEYGSDWVSVYDKACVVAVVMNRVKDGGWSSSNTIEGVLTAPYQFDGYYASSNYNSYVTESCIEAVEYYFNHMDEFPHYTSFYGDGTWNYFY